MFTVKKGSLYVKDRRKCGGKSSYTSKEECAVQYQTREQAQANACGNENVVEMRIKIVYY